MTLSFYNHWEVEQHYGIKYRKQPQALEELTQMSIKSNKLERGKYTHS